MKILEDLYYTKEHEWVRVEGDKAYIGITDFAQHELGDIVYIELPEIDDEFEIEESFGVVESVKAVSDLFMPVGGRITEINEDIEDDPVLVNNTPYESWFIEVELSDKTEVEDHMNAEEYEIYCEKEKEE